MRYLVTGSTGFVGRALVRGLVERFGAETVVCLTKPEDSEFEREGREEIEGLGVRTISADVRSWHPDPDDVPSFDVLFHLAASTSSQSREHSSNDRGTENLLKVLAPHLDGTRLVYASTAAVYDPKGSITRGLDEESPCRPRTEYGRTKLIAEGIVRDRAPASGYRYTILRLSTIYGDNVRPDGVFSLFAELIRRGHFVARIPWPGKLGIMHIDDLVRIFIAVAEDPDTKDEIFCVSTESRSILEIMTSISRALGVPHRPYRVPGILWSLIRLGLAIPGLLRVLPWSVAGPLWRLGHMVNHGFWCDGEKLQRHYPEPLIRLDDGIKSVLGLDHEPTEGGRRAGSAFERQPRLREAP